MRRISPFDKLSAKLGLEDAHNELRWINQSSSNPREVDRMIEERIKGKPLQYILGMTLVIPRFRSNTYRRSAILGHNNKSKATGR